MLPEEYIRKQAEEGNLHFSLHAHLRMSKRKVGREEVTCAILRGQIMAEMLSYCLQNQHDLLGFTLW